MFQLVFLSIFFMCGSFLEYPKLLDPKRLSKDHQKGCLTPIIYGLRGHDGAIHMEHAMEFRKFLKVYVGPYKGWYRIRIRPCIGRGLRV